MRYKVLSNSDLRVSEIGFGTMSLDLMNPKEAETLIHDAFECGINYFDTADLYDKGKNEVLVGKAISLFRKELILATKVGNRWRSDGSGWDWDVSPTYIREGLDRSLARLRTDYIDLYQIHGGTIEDDFEAVVDTLESLVSEGKIRYYGISSIRPNVFSKFCQKSNIVSNMMQYSVLDNRAEDYMSVFEASNVSVIARGTLAQGLLVNKDYKAYLDYSKEDVILLVEQIAKYCNNSGVSQTAFALKYVLNNPIVASALVGFRKNMQLSDILKSYSSLKSIDINFEQFEIKKIHYKEHLI